MRALFVTACSVVLAGCFAIADLDRFEQRDPTTETRDFQVYLSDLDDFAGLTLELQVKDVASVPFEIIARAVIVDLPVEHAFIMPNALPPGDYRVDLYIDDNGDGSYQSGEPAWSRPVDPDGVFGFAPDEALVDISDPPSTGAEDFILRLSGFNPHTTGNQAFELAVVHASDRRSVGYYLVPSIAATSFDTGIPGIVVPGEAYDIDFFVDFNQNGGYDAPPVDHTWRIAGEPATASGIDASFPHVFEFQDVAESFPEP
jgi:hypothetical protein